MSESLVRDLDCRAHLEEQALEPDALDSVANHLSGPQLPYIPRLRAGDMALDVSAFWWPAAGLGSAVATG